MIAAQPHGGPFAAAAQEGGRPTMTEATASPRRSRRAVAAKITGIVGIVVCAVLIVALWLARGAVSGAIDGLAADVSSTFDRAITATSAVAGRLDDAASSLDGIKGDATELASSSSPSPGRLANLQTRLAQVADSYRQLRERYAELRENIVTVVGRVQQAARIIPGARVPDGAADALKSVNDKLTALDDALTSTFGGAADGSSPTAQALAQRATALQTAVSGAATAVQGMSARLETAQSNTEATVNDIQTLLVIAALVISLLLIWVLLLNVALWLLGGAWQREEEKAPAVSPPQVDPGAAPAG
jgi:methyl-accepting chemotaxis protein